jgi:hypothetical protein
MSSFFSSVLLLLLSQPLILFLKGCDSSHAAAPNGGEFALISDDALIAAFSDAFEVRDRLSDARVEVVQAAVRQLDHLGVRRDTATLANLSEPVLARILMRAAIGNLALGMRDPADWSFLAADVASGKLVRRRSFSAVRVAVIESLLLISIVALGRAVWLKQHGQSSSSSNNHGFPPPPPSNQPQQPSSSSTLMPQQQQTSSSSAAVDGISSSLSSAGV